MNLRAKSLNVAVMEPLAPMLADCSLFSHNEQEIEESIPPHSNKASPRRYRRAKEKKKQGRVISIQRLNVHHPPLRPARAVPNRVQDPGNRPDGAQGGRIHGVLEARDEQRAEVGRQVLGEVGVGALGWNLLLFC